MYNSLFPPPPYRSALKVSRAPSGVKLYYLLYWREDRSAWTPIPLEGGPLTLDPWSPGCVSSGSCFSCFWFSCLPVFPMFQVCSRFLDVSYLSVFVVCDMLLTFPDALFFIMCFYICLDCPVFPGALDLLMQFLNFIEFPL